MLYPPEDFWAVLITCGLTYRDTVSTASISRGEKYGLELVAGKYFARIKGK